MISDTMNLPMNSESKPILTCCAGRLALEDEGAAGGVVHGKKNACRTIAARNGSGDLTGGAGFVPLCIGKRRADSHFASA